MAAKISRVCEMAKSEEMAMKSENVAGKLGENVNFSGGGGRSGVSIGSVNGEMAKAGEENGNL